MPEPITTAGGSAGQVAASAPPVPVAQPEAPPPAPAPEPKPEEKSLAEVIRDRRAARETAQREASRAQSLEAQVRELKAALEEKSKAVSDFEDDPVGYAKSRKWSPEQQLLYGKALMFDLVPEKADPEFRIKMFEEKQAREAKKKESEAQERERKQAEELSKQYLNDFYTTTHQGVRAFAAGSYPESEAWFGDDLDVYMQSLMATASNLATTANKQGRVADLSPAALAAALEAEVARKMSQRDQRRAATKTVAEPQAQPAAGVEQDTETVSTRNLNGGGAPVPPPRSDKERIQRAIAAGFRSR